jgi:hypothetical protein
MKKLILGIGTGRCGTVSLSNLLNSQNKAEITHELQGQSVNWYGGANQFNAIYSKIISRQSDFVGDVSFYHLPFLEMFMDKNPDIKIVVLKRDKQEVISSFKRKAPLNDHWRNHDGKTFVKTLWDKCFPKFDADSREQAISLYYDDYYVECEKLDQTKCFWLQTSELNDEEKVMEMLTWCGFENPIFKKFHKNRT